MSQNKQYQLLLSIILVIFVIGIGQFLDVNIYIKTALLLIIPIIYTIIINRLAKD